jgi:hypothetical protein
MKVWSYYNMPNRYKYCKKNKLRYPTSLSQYFWGKGYAQGYAAEAFGTHLALIHPNALVG